MAVQVSTHSTLIHRLQHGVDSQAWGDFVGRYGALIRAVACKHGLQDADADDVLQEVLIGLSRAMPRFIYNPQQARFRTFLHTVVRREILRRFRQERPARAFNETDAIPSQDDSDAIWEAEWRQYHLGRAMEAIDVEFSARDRRAFAMYVGNATPALEVATELKLSLDQIYQIKSRIMKRLGEIIEIQVEEEG